MIYPKKIKNKTINKFFKITILVLALVSYNGSICFDSTFFIFHRLSNWI